MPSYLFETLPSPVLGSFGQTVSLSSILTQEFGPNFGGYTDFYLAAFDWHALQKYSPQLSYWTATTTNYGEVGAGTTTQWLQSGAPVTSAVFDQKPAPYYNPLVDIPAVDDPTTGVVHVAKANVGQFSLQIGSDIAPFAFVSVPIAYDPAHNPTEFAQYSITTVDPALYSTTAGKGAPTADDVVAAADRLALKYAGAASPSDCHFIAQDVAAAAGAPLNDLTESTDPTANVSSGFWRIAYRGSDPNPVEHWSTLVQKGDIVRFGRKDLDGDGQKDGQHTFTVLDTKPAGDGVHAKLTVYDNGVSDPSQNVNTHNVIGIHDDYVGNHYYDDESDPTEVTIYRLGDDHLNLLNASDLSLGSQLGVRLDGTAYSDKITGGPGDDIVRGWTGSDVLDGKAGTNTLDYSWALSTVTVDLLTGTASKPGGGTDQFSNFQKFVGGSGPDVFDAKGGTFDFDGGGGTDTLDYSSAKNNFHITVDLQQHTVTKATLPYIMPQTDTFSSVESFVGTGGNDTFVSAIGSYHFDGGGGTGNVLVENATQVGTVFDLAAGTAFKGKLGLGSLGTDTFANIQHFAGSAGGDTFKSVDGGSYIFDGAGGQDTLDFSAAALSGVKIDLGNQTAEKGLGVTTGDLGGGIIGPKVISLGTDTFSDIEAFKGSAKGDTFIDGAGSHTFDGGGGVDTVVLHGQHGDYDQWGYLATDGLWHTTVSAKGASVDGTLDLVHVEQLQFTDGTFAVSSGLLSPGWLV